MCDNARERERERDAPVDKCSKVVFAQKDVQFARYCASLSLKVKAGVGIFLAIVIEVAGLYALFAIRV